MMAQSVASNQMHKSPLSKRRLVLVLLAVAIPILALTGLGIGLILQESQLAETRRIEAYEQTFEAFVTELDHLAAFHRLQIADQITEDSWSALDHLSSGPVMLVGEVVGGQLLLPWQLSGQSRRFQGRIHSGPYGRSLLRAEQYEYTEGALDQAIRTYRATEALTQDTLQQAFARLSLARALDKAGIQEEADNERMALLEVPIRFSDENGVPLALYAAQQLADDKQMANLISEKLISFATFPLHLSPLAGNFYRAIHDTLRAVTGNEEYPRLDRIGDYVQATLSAIRLQEDFTSILPRLSSQSGERSSALYAGGDWLLSVHSDTTRSYELVIALDARELVRETKENLQLSSLGFDVTSLSNESSAPNKWLGPAYPEIFAHLSATEAPGQALGLMSRVSFIILAMVLIISLTTIGFYLWWRDTRREIVTAELRSNFVSSVSHELKTPLTSIRMFAETLRFRSPPEEIREDYLDTIINESGRLTRLLNNVLDFSKLERGAKEYNLRPTILQDVVSAALESMEYPLKAQEFKLATEIDEEEIHVNADSDAIEQIILNLLTNAMKFSDNRREIVIGVNRNGHFAELWVQDWGLGIDPEDLDNIFTSYYRTEKAVKTNVPGTGLGLSLVQHAVDSHHGHIEVSSALGAGSTFTVKLPLA